MVIIVDPNKLVVMVISVGEAQTDMMIDEEVAVVDMMTEEVLVLLSRSAFVIAFSTSMFKFNFILILGGGGRYDDSRRPNDYDSRRPSYDDRRPSYDDRRPSYDDRRPNYDDRSLTANTP